MEAIFRIELKTKGYKALVLPLNYIAISLLKKGKEFGEQFQSHASSMELHNLECAQRTEVLVRRSWSSECSTDEVPIVLEHGPFLRGFRRDAQLKRPCCYSPCIKHTLDHSAVYPTLSVVQALAPASGCFRLRCPLKGIASNTR